MSEFLVFDTKNFISLGLDIPYFVEKDGETQVASFNWDLNVLTQKHKTVLICKQHLRSLSTSFFKKNLKSDNPQIIAQKIYLAIHLIKEEGINKISQSLINNSVQDLIELSLNKPVKEFLVRIPSSDAQKIITRTFLCKILANKIGITSNPILYKLLFSSMVCDIGKYEGHESKDLHHAQITIKKLKGMNLGSDVEQIILHHHENNDGTGPFKLKKSKTNPLARVIRVCDAFCEDLFKKTNKDIIFKKMINESPRLYDLTLVRSLSSIF